MNDNAWPHWTLVVQELLESEDITRIDWPAYFPDLNPIDHVWDDLGRRFAARFHHPENTQQPKHKLIDEWALLPQEILHQLVLSMRRCFILWQVKKRNRSFNQLTFRIALDRQLINVYSSRKRKGCPASFQKKKGVALDDVRGPAFSTLDDPAWKIIHQRWFSTIDDEGNVVENDKKRDHATCV
ncbi:transposable element Tc1 transposase [Trichonephila clavipes]|nr:transposable element Tc1 transposase [Trichonephila clavipes]